MSLHRIYTYIEWGYIKFMYRIYIDITVIWLSLSLTVHFKGPLPLKDYFTLLNLIFVISRVPLVPSPFPNWSFQGSPSLTGHFKDLGCWELSFGPQWAKNKKIIKNLCNFFLIFLWAPFPNWSFQGSPSLTGHFKVPLPL